MMTIKKTIVKRIFTTVWLGIGVGTIVLLVAAIQKKDAQHCSGVSINIEGVNNNFFVDKKDIFNSVTSFVGGTPSGKPINAFDLKKIEGQLEKNIWVRNAQLFFDNNNKLTIKVLEREPMARVFTTGGTTFYIDSAIAMLPLSEKFSARLPVFTGFPSDKIVLAPTDSALLKNILAISMAIQKDSFNMALIDQINITPQRNFELVPKIGYGIIFFGDANNITDKFKKLQLFYRQVMAKAGWNKYSIIDVRYTGQIVAKRKGAEDKSSDSLRTFQLMQQIAANAEQQSNDSLHHIAQDNENNTTDINLVNQSMERDDEGMGNKSFKMPAMVNPFAEAPLLVAPAVVAAKTIVKQVATKLVSTSPSVKAPVKLTGHLPAKKKPIVSPVKVLVKKPKAILPKPTAKPILKPVVKKQDDKPATKSIANEY